MSHVEPQQLIEELTADLEHDDAVALTVELTRMIDLGVLEVDGDPACGEPLRVAIVEAPPAAA